MRVSREEMEKSHQRIVASAGRLLREKGIESAGVDDVMKDAGLTRGGFYRHFADKDEMVGAGLEAVFGEIINTLDKRMSKDGPKAALEAYRANYLTLGHVKHPGMGCPIAAVAGDVARGPASLKSRFGTSVKRVIDRLAQGMRGTPEKREAAAWRELAMLAGAVALARSTDEETARKILDACRTKAERI